MVRVKPHRKGHIYRGRIKRKELLLGASVFVFLISLALLGGGGRARRLREAHWRPGQGLLSSLRGPPQLSEKEKLQMILEAKVNLIDLKWNHKLTRTSKGAEYHGVYGLFCTVEWGLRKANPLKYPVFYDIIEASPDCMFPIVMDLSKVVPKAVAYDSMPDAKVKSLNFTAAVFQESRCGGTQVANMLELSDPTKNRVYAESPPPLSALGYVCGHENEICSMETSAALLQDVLYLMGRTNDFTEERVFFKFHGAATRHLPTFQMAFPDKPWMFLYRNPAAVLENHLANGDSAACLHQKQHPPKSVRDVVFKHAGPGKQASELSNEEYCAAHLASITEAAVKNLNEHVHLVAYDELPGRLYDEVLPSFLGAPLKPEQTVEITATVGGLGLDDKASEASASDEIKLAAVTYLEESYNELKSQRAKQNAVAVK